MTGYRQGFIDEAFLLRRIAMTHQNVIAEHTDTSTSQINRIVAKQAGIPLDKVVPFLNAIGMDVVERQGDMVTVPRDEFEAVCVLARKALRQALG